MNETGRILIVDDDENVRRSLCRDLSRLGYACATAADGAEAMEQLQAEEFDVVLSDLRMPRMGGIELLGAIQERELALIPIVLSGAGQISEAVEATKRGAFDFIEKPARIEVVHATVARALRHLEALRRARAMADAVACWEATFDSSPDMIVVLDTEGTVIRANRVMAQRLRVPRGELIGKGCHEAICGDDHEARFCPFLEKLRIGQRRSYELEQHRWGGWFEIHSAPLADNQDQLLGSVHVIRDITDRKQAEEVLRDARAEAELLVRSISSILICLDENGIVRQWNRSAQAAFGKPSFEIVGRKLCDCGVQWEWQAIGEALSQCMTRGNPVRLDDVRFRRADGVDGFLAVTLNPMKGNGPRSVGVLILGRDITERKLLESQLAQAQKLESIGQLAAGIAHEINTPMQYVGDNIRFLDETFAELLGFLGRCKGLLSAASTDRLAPELVRHAQAAAEEVDVDYLTEEIPNAIRQSLEGISRVTRIVRAMRDFSHPGAEEKVAIDINRAIESTITVCRNEWKYVAEMATEFDPELPPVPCFPGELNQVVLNLIVNAAHAIEKVVGRDTGAKGTITVSTARQGNWVKLRVRDTGCGIPPEIREKVWEPFFTTKEVGKGTGQGLAFARSLVVTKHGGKVDFESEVGAGTTFTLLLPLVCEALPPQPSPKEPIHA